jgi:DNA-directed DNA polymerase III PolC
MALMQSVVPLAPFQLLKPNDVLINCHTYYSFNFGTITPQELVAFGSENGYTQLALTDINNTSGVFDFVAGCNSAGIKPIIGIDFRNIEVNASPLYIGIAKNNLGYFELNQFLSYHLHSGEPLPDKAPIFENVLIIYPFGAKGDLKENEFIGIRPKDLNRLFRADEKFLKQKCIALYPITYKKEDEFYLHCLLRSIHHNTLLKKLDKKDVTERGEQFITPSELVKAFEKYPYLLLNTQALMEQCEFKFDFKSHKNKKCFTGSVQEDRTLLHSLCQKGMVYRYGQNNHEAQKRLEKELDVIEKLDFISYFLISWDLIRYAKEQGYYYVGRGSGANSIAAYCLRITDVDPIELNLFFERFLNMHRTSPPDFDMDFSWKDRDDVIGYLFKKYGNEHTAWVGSHNTYKYRSVARELGKVYGLPEKEIEEFVEGSEFDRHMKVKRNPNTLDVYFEKIYKLGKQLEKFPHYLSIHACGIVISEAHIHTMTATHMPPKNFQATQFDMYVADSINLHKLDVLSQRGLGHIKDCVEIISKNHGIEIDIQDIVSFKKDPHLNDLLSTGNTIGCFYIESPAMRNLMRKLKCHDYLTLVAASSIIRPGVSDSGMQREFIKRCLNPDTYKAIHPKIGEILDETFGVMVYQEDVIKVAHFFAGFTLAEADMLRRAMAWKFRDNQGFNKMESKYYSNCKELGYPFEVASEVWRQMVAFAGYSFCKAHSASYAVESYQSLYLKAYYPVEFMVAVMNNFGGFYNTEFYMEEARRYGAVIHGPCVNHSQYLTSVWGKDIHLGLILIKGLQSTFAQQIVSEREDNGDYVDLTDFCERHSPEIAQLMTLIKIGAFRFTGKTKKQLRWEALLMKSEKQNTITLPASLFPTQMKKFEIPRILQSYRADAFEEVELLGFPICSRFDLLTTPFRGEIKAIDLTNNIGHLVTMVGFITTMRTARTKKGDIMQFASLRDDEGGNFEVTLFPNVFKSHPIIYGGIYAMTGKVVDDYGVASLEVLQWERLPISFQDLVTNVLEEPKQDYFKRKVLRN